MDYLKGDERRGLLRTGIVVASTLGEQTFPQNGAILSVRGDTHMTSAKFSDFWTPSPTSGQSGF